MTLKINLPNRTFPSPYHVMKNMFYFHSLLYKYRYSILASQAAAAAETEKKCCQVILDSNEVKMEIEKYRIGHTKACFICYESGDILETLRLFKNNNSISILEHIESFPKKCFIDTLEIL